MKKIGEVCDLQNGFAFKSSEYVNSGFFVMRIANVQDGFISLVDPKYISKIKDKFQRFILNDGNILISLTGNVGRVGIINQEHLPAVLNQRVARIKPYEKELDRLYLFYFLRSPIFLAKIINKGHGMAQKNVSTEDIKRIEIPVPSIVEQRRIVKRIEKLFAKIDEAQKLREESKKSASVLLQSVLNKIFSGPKSPPSLKLRRASKKWERVKLGNLIKALTPPKKILKSNFSENGKFPIIDQSQNEISGWSNDKTALVPISQPVVIFGDHTCAVKFCEKPFIQGADGIKILSTNEKILPRFLYLLLKINPLKSISYRRHFSKLKEKEILLPPIAEQKKIVAYLDSLSEKVRKLQDLQQKTADDFKNLKKSILSQAFSGKL